VGQDVRDVCRESGFDGFLPKPADRDAIAAELDRLAGAGTRKLPPAVGLSAVDGAAAAAAAAVGLLFSEGNCSPIKPSSADAKLPPAVAGGDGLGLSSSSAGGGSSFLPDMADFDTPRPAF
jgi:hypothetical protein